MKGEIKDMRNLLIMIAVLGMTAVYQPDSIIPKYFIDKTPQNTYRVYDSRQMVVPKYIVKPDPWGKGYRVYETGKPVLPVYRIEQKDQVR
jgi:hypothetical protein